MPNIVVQANSSYFLPASLIIATDSGILLGHSQTFSVGSCRIGQERSNCLHGQAASKVLPLSLAIMPLCIRKQEDTGNGNAIYY